MNRLSIILRTLAVTALAVAILALYIPVVLSSGMSAVLSLNAIDAKARKDMVTHRWSLEEAARWNPHDYHALYRLGSYHIERKEDEPARAAYEACIEKSPGHLGGLLGLADIYTRAGEFDKATACVTRGREVAPTSWRAYLAAGTLASRLGNQDEAIRLLEKADHFARSPQVGVFNQMAVAYLLDGDAQKSLDIVVDAMATTKGNAETRLVQGKALLILNRPDEAIAPLQAAIKGFSKDPVQRSDARLHLAGALAVVDRLLESSEIVRDEVRESGDVPQVRATAVKINGTLQARMMGHELTAETTTQIHCNLAYAYAAMGMLDDALRQFEAASANGVTLESSCIWAHAETLLRIGRIEEAVARYESAVMAGPAPVQMRLGLAEGLTRLGRTSEARMQYVLLLRAYLLNDKERAHIQSLADGLQ